MMRKILCLVLCLALLGSNLMMASAEFDVIQGYTQPDPADLLEVTLKIHSNLSDITELTGLYFDDVFYIDYEEICQLTGSRIFSQDDSKVVFSMHGGQRKITVTNDCELTESYGSDSFSMDIPTASADGRLYISAAHILRYMGAEVAFSVNENSGTHMAVSMPYTVLDLYRDFQNAGGYTFSWSEADGKYVDPEALRHLAVVDTIYFGYDSHLIFQGLFEGYSELVMEDMCRDVLLDVIQVSGAELVEQEDPVLKLFGDLSDEIVVTQDWIEGVAIGSGADGIGDLVKLVLEKSECTYIDDVFGATKTFFKLTSSSMSALQTIKQYDSVTAAQRNVLDRTLNRVWAGTELYNLSPMVFNAAKLAQKIMDDVNVAATYEGSKMLLDVVLDVVTSNIPVVSTVATVTEIVTETLKQSELTQKILNMEECITFASVSNTVSGIGQALLGGDAPQMNIYPTKAEGMQTLVQADILLTLKSTILTRQRLIESGTLTEPAENTMGMKNKWAGELLNKAENAEVTMGLSAPSVPEDLTWIEKLAGKGYMGMAVDTGKYTYYWQFDPQEYETETLMGFFSNSSAANLVRRDLQGNEQVLFSGTASPFVITATQVFYNENGSICSRNLDGSNDRQWTTGQIVAVAPYGQYLLYENEGIYYGLDTWNGQQFQLFDNGDFEGYHNGVVYYSVPVFETEYEAAQNGKVILRAVNIDGTDDRMMVTTPEDLNSDSTYSAATIQKLYFGEKGIYFSYGCVAGTGLFFQGGRIVRVSYDGTQVEVVAGQTELVDANFGIREDGSVITSDDMDFVYYDDTENYYCWDDGLYWMDPSTGVAKELLKIDRYSSDVSCDASYVSWVEVWGDTAIFMVHFCDWDSENDFGWRQYTSRVQSIVYKLNLKKDKLEQIYTF